MSESFDVIVVGARCAGASLATLLARGGLGVFLLDKDRFPSDTLSTHGIQPAGVQVLERLGVPMGAIRVLPGRNDNTPGGRPPASSACTSR